MEKDKLSLLRDYVAQAVRETPVQDRLKEFTIEVGEDGDGEEFLRILITVRQLDDVSVDNLDNTVTIIEEKLSGIDDRYPSVRFADAA